MRIIHSHKHVALPSLRIVGVNSAESIRQLKGAGRPILSVLDRVEILAALECVDHVVIFDDLVPTPIFQRLRADIHCKGTDLPSPPP